MEYQISDLDHPFLQKLSRLDAERPSVLYIRGQLPDAGKAKVFSIVGSRRCTPYGEDIAYKLAFELAKRGAIIVSGLAYGIDSCAHRGCLDAGGTTVAILGTPIDKIYPSSHFSLAERILEKGAIISEYPPGHETRPYHFLQRNRIVASLADAVIIVEASNHSGTFQTFSMASNFDGCKVFAVPGDITRPMSYGCNMMLGSSAIALTSVEDFVNQQYPSSSTKRVLLRGLPKDELAIAEQIQSGISQGKAIMDNLEMAPRDFNCAITLLELKGVVRPLGCNQWALA